MKNELEERLWLALTKEDFKVGETIPKEIESMLSEGLIDSRKQAYATLSKWEDEGLIEYGVSLVGCWRRGEGVPRRLRRSLFAKTVSGGDQDPGYAEAIDSMAFEFGKEIDDQIVNYLLEGSREAGEV